MASLLKPVYGVDPLADHTPLVLYTAPANSSILMNITINNFTFIYNTTFEIYRVASGGSIDDASLIACGTMELNESRRYQDTLFLSNGDTVQVAIDNTDDNLCHFTAQAVEPTVAPSTTLRPLYGAAIGTSSTLLFTATQDNTVLTNLIVHTGPTDEVYPFYKLYLVPAAGAVEDKYIIVNSQMDLPLRGRHLLTDKLFMSSGDKLYGITDFTPTYLAGDIVEPA